MKAPASWLQRRISVMNRQKQLNQIPSEVADGEGGQDPALQVQRPLELVGHLDDGDRHDDPVGGVDEVGQRAQDHQLEAFGEEVDANHRGGSRGVLGGGLPAAVREVGASNQPHSMAGGQHASDSSLSGLGRPVGRSSDAENRIRQ